jgi:hypothetical protein
METQPRQTLNPPAPMINSTSNSPHRNRIVSL